MKQQFEPGDVVRLRSGSHDMTVSDVDGDDTLLIWVAADGTFKHEKVPVATLMILPDHPGNAK